MSLVRRLVRSTRGSAAAEMALVLPLLIVLLFGSVELGNYFYSEHVLVKGVRDGARYAARQAFSNFTACSGSPGATVENNTETLVRTGQLSGGSDILPNWTDAGTTFDVTINCTTTISGTALEGIYNDVVTNAGAAVGAPVVTVTASVPYRSVFGYVGRGLNLKLNATSQAAVQGI